MPVSGLTYGNVSSINIAMPPGSGAGVSLRDVMSEQLADKMEQDTLVAAVGPLDASSHLKLQRLLRAFPGEPPCPRWARDDRAHCFAAACDFLTRHGSLALGVAPGTVNNAFTLNGCNYDAAHAALTMAHGATVDSQLSQRATIRVGPTATDAGRGRVDGDDGLSSTVDWAARADLVRRGAFQGVQRRAAPMFSLSPHFLDVAIPPRCSTLASGVSI